MNPDNVSSDNVNSDNSAGIRRLNDQTIKKPSVCTLGFAIQWSQQISASFGEIKILLFETFDVIMSHIEHFIVVEVIPKDHFSF